MKNSDISWCHHTFSPWWGCAKVSPACLNCYAKGIAVRNGHNVWGPTSHRRFFDDWHWLQPLKWNSEAMRTGTRPRVFSASMADIFEDRSDLIDTRSQLFELIRATPRLDWLLLTKRPENITQMLPSSWGLGWKNVWLGVTVENQQQANQRLPILREIPSRIRFVSCEPLLGPVGLDLEGISWVIAGGESGRDYRDMKPRWATWIRDQCIDQGVAFHFKQWSGIVPKKLGRLLDGRTWDEIPNS